MSVSYGLRTKRVLYNRCIIERHLFILMRVIFFSKNLNLKPASLLHTSCLNFSVLIK